MANFGYTSSLPEKKRKEKVVYSSTTNSVHHLAEIDPSVKKQSIELDKGQG